MLILIFLILVGFGWANIYAASYVEKDVEVFDFSSAYGKQLLWLLMSIPLIVLILFVNTKFYQEYSNVFYIISLLSLIGLFVFGKEINGAKSWYRFGNVSIQPSEFAKVFTALALAKLMSGRRYNLKIIRNQLKSFIIIFLPAFLVGLHDPGSAIVYLSLFFVLNREGLTLAYLIIGFLALTLFILTISIGIKIMLIALVIIITLYFTYSLFKNGRFLKLKWINIMATCVISVLFILSADYSYNHVLKKHQRDRFEVLLGKNKDKKRTGYNIDQSIETISSGKFWGKGFLQGDKTRGNFVPAQETDYIFSVVGEEWGFFGASLLILLFLALISRIINKSDSHPNKFVRIYGYGAASILFFHLVINVGMVLGLLPTIGIPLPYVSYGGSSLWGFTILLFIFVKLEKVKTYD